MDHFERIEAALEELTRHPDRIIHESYLAYALHDCAGLAELAAEQRRELLHKVALSCHRILCPPVSVGAAGNQVYLLVQQNPDRSADAIARTAGAAFGTVSGGSNLPCWGGDYSVVSVGAGDVEKLAADFSGDDCRAGEAFAKWADEE